MIQFHLDEHVSTAVASGLRQHHIEVSTSVEAGLLGAGDDALLEFSATRGSVIVTHDEDFLRFHALSANHAGIVYCHQDKYSVGELLELF